jgi:2-polyprenyl-6-methoxyphenol hydroxylase-like FAD-dependent oxidoreductase
MAGAKRITIVGGGLAGLSVGIGLRHRQVPVVILEAGHYPRHRVCGEFISGRGQDTLRRLGLLRLIESAGAVRAETAAFFSAQKPIASRRLPAPAFCLSRFALDAALARRFRESGGELREDSRGSTEDFSEGSVRATGRRAREENGDSHWFGLKIHAHKITPAADLEMHVSPAGYVGLCKIPGDKVNVCGLFRKSANRNDGTGNWRDLLCGPPGSPLNNRMASAEFDEKSFCAMAGLNLRPQRSAARSEICIGDAITMIPPVTGNGMSMAFESAERAIEPLAAWSRGELSWSASREIIARDCDRLFRRRLTWAGWLQRLVLAPVWQNPLLAFAARNQWFWRQAFGRTR